MLGERTTEAARVLACFGALRRALGGDILTAAGDSITPAQFYALGALAERDRTAGELARTIAISMPSLTQLVDLLVDRGWVTRYPDPTDRRKVRLTLTEIGRELYGRAHEAAETRLAALLEDLNQHERFALIEGLEALRRSVHARWLATKGRSESSPSMSRP